MAARSASYQVGNHLGRSCFLESALDKGTDCILIGVGIKRLDFRVGLETMMDHVSNGLRLLFCAVSLHRVLLRGAFNLTVSGLSFAEALVLCLFEIKTHALT